MEPEGMDEENMEYPSKMKNSHGRKKMYQTIQERMEFYFSDANLSKDRFMTNLLNESPEIDVSVFLKFNRIRELTDNVGDIVKALKKSALLTVTEDKSKVFRTAPVKKKENVDECTIYVEQLPMDGDHDWLKGIFSQFGKVDYVSVPKFKHSGKIKGFAFVEFETPEGAMNALDAFTNAGCKLPSTILPNQLCSIATFDRSEKDVIKRNRIFSLCNENKNEEDSTNGKKKETDEDTSAEDMGKKHGGKKRQHESITCPVPKKVAHLETSEEEKTSEEKSKKSRRKKVKIDESANTCDKVSSDDSESKKKRKAVDDDKSSSKKDSEVESDANESIKAEDSANENCEQEGTDGSDASRKKRRKKKKKKSKKAKSDIASSGLQVLAKCEWKKLRNKYLELQRSKMNSLKQYLAKIKHDDNQHIMRIDKTENPSSDNTTAATKDSTSTPRVQYTPGVILKLTFDEPVIDVKAFKNEVKSHEGVQYVDVSEGAFLAFVRCSDGDIAKQLNAEKLWTNSTVLKGKDEKNYWDKILKDRQEKLTNKSLRANQKGRTKLLKKAEKALGKRIRFDSD